MKIGIPKEIKRKEYRVACTHSGVRALTAAGHQVLVQAGAGIGSGCTDAQYVEAGAKIVPTAADAWAADMIYKVKEPIAAEYDYLRPGLVLFTYLNLAADAELTKALVKSRTTGIAYETIRVGNKLPLLEPMSEIAGRMSAIVGSYFLGQPFDGRGVLLGGVPGVLPARVVIIGGGTAGVNAATMALGLGAEVIILEIDVERMRLLDFALKGVRTLFSTELNLEELLPTTDLVIGAVLIPGAKAPKLIKRKMLARLRPGSVLVDIAIDQGGCAETSRATTHDNPVFVQDGVVHYCVANMPGAYPQTASQALMHATLPFALRLAGHGAPAAWRQSPELRGGVNTLAGQVTCQPVAEAHGLPWHDLKAEA